MATVRGITWKRILDLLAMFLKPILNLASPMIKEMLDKFLTAWYKKALETENPADDYLVEFIAGILGLDIMD